MTNYLVTFDPSVTPSTRTIAGDGFTIENGWLFVFAVHGTNCSNVAAFPASSVESVVSQ
jgi:hypothetical protein